MPHIETAADSRKIVWTQDSHGQWSSGDLEVRPICTENGKYGCVDCGIAEILRETTSEESD